MFKIKPTKQLIRERGLHKGGKVQKFIDSEVIRCMDAFVPFATGRLCRRPLHHRTAGAPNANRRKRHMRVKITLACTECKQRNYNTFKNKKNDPDRLEFNKYCRFCRKHTAHREAK